MPTRARLTIKGLEAIEVAGDGPNDVWRFLYGPTDFIRTVQSIIHEDEESSYGSDLRLPEQLDNLFHAFTSGRRLHHDEEFHSMQPEKDAVWELKTPDLRIFGWFLKRDHFACVNLIKADTAKGTGEFAGFDVLYPHIRSSIVRRRRDLGCFPHHCVRGAKPYDVISVRDRL